MCSIQKKLCRKHKDANLTFIKFGGKLKIKNERGGGLAPCQAHPQPI